MATSDVPGDGDMVVKSKIVKPVDPADGDHCGQIGGQPVVFPVVALPIAF